MNPPLTDNIWQRKGISVIWDVEALASLGPLSEAVSLRDFFCWGVDCWSQSSPSAQNLAGRKHLVVAGLEAALDAMTPEDAESWMTDRLLALVRDCSKTLFGGGDNGALIFWMVVPGRFRVGLHNDTVFWKCDGEHRDHEIEFSHGLWNGAYKDVQRIVPADCGNSDVGMGFYLQRIS